MSQSKEINIEKLKLNESNPRYIKDDRFEKLKKSIEEFPRMLELRPIIYDPQTMDVLGGNMRLRALLSLGYKNIPERWVKSAESLTEAEKERFIIVDNVGFGEWDYDILANEWGEEKLREWGLEVVLEEMEEGEEMEFEQSVQIEPPREYILIMADPNSVEWEELKEMLKLKMVRRGGYKKGSQFDAVGLERVIEWSDFKERYVNSDTK